jgi:hypothetical protein
MLLAKLKRPEGRVPQSEGNSEFKFMFSLSGVNKFRHDGANVSGEENCRGHAGL